MSILVLMQQGQREKAKFKQQREKDNSAWMLDSLITNYLLIVSHLYSIAGSKVTTLSYLPKFYLCLFYV